MLRSMYTSISALNLHQTYLDVIADNLANANTPAYKTSRVTFKDQFSQLLSSGSAPTDTMGGINAVQIGLGSRLGDVSLNFSQGTMQSTGRITDVGVQGDGFLIYNDGTSSFYSRDGALGMDSSGMLVNMSTGLRVQGWSADGGTIDTGTPIGDLQVPIDSSLARATGTSWLGGNLNADGNNSFDVTLGVYDSLGALQSVTVTFARQGVTNVWDWSATSGATGSGTITFDTDGQYSAGGGTITVPGANGAAATTVTLDMTEISQLSTASDVSAVNQDGLEAGSLSGFSVISNTGEIFAIYTNGLQETIGQIAMANFTNPSGLNRVGESLFAAGLNSGDPQVGASDTGGRGKLRSGYLEASTVDLAQEFTNMILAQRGFQAASRVITTSDEMLQELVNLNR